MQTYQLANGLNLPKIGFGTWDIPDGEPTTQAVANAVKCGYRLIDCAILYGNQPAVAKGLARSGIARQDIMVSSKVWNTHRGKDKALASFAKSLKQLDLEYFDLFLIHWPANAKQNDNWREINLGTWSALEQMYREGLVRAIGVSNFLPRHLQALLDKAAIAPMVNQIELHPGYAQLETLEFCQNNHIQVEAWSPLGEGLALKHSLIMELAAKYAKSPAQVCLRWILQHNALPLPRTTEPAYMQNNLDLLGFELTAADMQSIDELETFAWSGLHPDEVEAEFM